ncbi:hypothetical protein LZK75_36915 (plasmid) [Rhizobium leguminosarum]|nr:hypothetical protein LZK75_36915 [Rhizobium leguminosarum]
MSNIKFEIFVDESLSKVTSVAQLKTALNKRLVSFVNDFEDGKWCHQDFQNYIWNNITQTALSERERQSLTDQGFTALYKAAKIFALPTKTRSARAAK